MVSDVKKARPNNKMLISRDGNYSRMMAGNRNGRAPHQCDILQ